MKLLRLLGALVLAAGVAAPARAQSAVTSADIQRLQDVIYDASRDMAQVRSRDAALASQLQAELDDARDEAIYLKVKLRQERTDLARRVHRRARSHREHPQPRARRLRGRVHAARRLALGVGPTPAAAARPRVVRRIRTKSRSGPSSTFGFRRRSASKTAQVEDRFEATTMVDLLDERGRVLVPAGSVDARRRELGEQSRRARIARAA